MFKKYKFFDYVFFIYNVIFIGFSFFQNDYYKYLILHISCVVFQYILISKVNEKKHNFITLIRFSYPLLSTIFLYQELNNFITIFSDKFYDDLLAKIDRTITGVDISLYFGEFNLKIMNEIFHFSYLSYFFYLVFLPIYFFYKRKDVILNYINSATLSFYFSYLIFLFIPATGPRYYFFNDGKTYLVGYNITNFVKNMVYNGGLYGGAFPSTHCAITFVGLYYLVKNQNKWMYLWSIPVFMLFLATVWCRFHFLIDSIAGILIAFIIIKLLEFFKVNK